MLSWWEEGSVLPHALNTLRTLLSPGTNISSMLLEWKSNMTVFVNDWTISRLLSYGVWAWQMVFEPQPHAIRRHSPGKEPKSGHLLRKLRHHVEAKMGNLECTVRKRFLRHNFFATVICVHCSWIVRTGLKRRSGAISFLFYASVTSSRLVTLWHQSC